MPINHYSPLTTIKQKITISNHYKPSLTIINHNWTIKNIMINIINH